VSSDLIFRSKEVADLDARLNVRGASARCFQSRGGTSKYEIKERDVTEEEWKSLKDIINVTCVGMRHHRDRGPVDKNTKFTLEPEPDNEYDPDAIRVLADGKMAGYVSKEQAKILKEEGLSTRRVAAMNRVLSSVWILKVEL
jgi:hypothetical protein